MQQGAKNTYFGNIRESFKSLLTGLKLSVRHLFQAKESRKPLGIHEPDYFEQKTGIFTTQYPKESIPVPDNGRYRLHNEIDDCIVCDKCAKICPVDCIEIEPIKAVEEIGKTSDGTPKRLYAAKFDIDMGKCCFCGLCTTVCPTECLTMTKAYDFSEYDVADHIYAFSEMTPLEILEKKQEIEKATREKELAKAAKTQSTQEAVGGASEVEKAVGKPAFKPRVPVKPKTSTASNDSGDEAKNKALELMRAKLKKSEEIQEEASTETKTTEGQAAKKPVFKPRIPVKPPSQQTENQGTEPTDETQRAEQKPVKPVFRPKIHPRNTEETAKPDDTAKDEPAASSENAAPKPARPVFKPKIHPKRSAENKNTETEKDEVKSLPANNEADSARAPRPVFKPRIHPKNTAGTTKPEEDVKDQSTESRENAAHKKVKPKIPVKRAAEDHTEKGEEVAKNLNQPPGEGNANTDINSTPEVNTGETVKPDAQNTESGSEGRSKAKPKPVYRPRPIIRKKPGENDNN